MLAPSTRRAILATTSLLGLGSLGISQGQTTAAKAGDQLDAIRSRKLLRVAVPKEFPPFGFMHNGNPDGYDIAVARMLAMDLNVRVELVPVVSADRMPMLLDDKVDVIIASLGKNPEREKVIDFSMAYAPLYLGVFGSIYPRTPETADFKDRRVGVTKGSLEESELRKQLPAASPVLFENSAKIIDAYLNQDIEYIAAGNVIIEAIKDSRVRLQTQRKHLLKDSPCYIGVRKGEPRVLQAVNSFIQRANSSQALMVSALQWFRATLPPDFFKPNKAA